MTRSPSTTFVSLSTAFIESFVRALAASLEAVAAMMGLGLRPGRRGLRVEQMDDLFDVDVRVPDLQVGHESHGAHRLAVGLAQRQDGLLPDALGETADPAGHHEARGETLDVPLPRPGQGLVEVVAVEHEGALGRAERAEIGEVGVSAHLGVQTGARRGRQVGGHDQRRPAEERERRDEHAPVADRDELLHPRPRLLLEQRDRVGPIGAGSEGGVAVARRPWPGPPSPWPGSRPGSGGVRPWASSSPGVRPPRPRPFRPPRPCFFGQPRLMRRPLPRLVGEVAFASAPVGDHNGPQRMEARRGRAVTLDYEGGGDVGDDVAPLPSRPPAEPSTGLAPPESPVTDESDVTRTQPG